MENARILVVEDDKTTMQVTGLMLEKLGYKVLRAMNGKDALEIYNTYLNEINPFRHNNA